ncbi:MAG: DMT family transporter [Candidatus Gastranaerophilales bacterium]|nr:DMT family transporter [Candidatus Gastranaerophilales bacterium]
MFFTTIAVILRIFSNPVANMFEKKVSSDGSSLYTSLYSYIFMGLCCIPFAFQYDWASLPAAFWQNALIAGFLCSVGRACMIKALQLGELSVLGPINSYKSVVGLIIGIILLAEIPSIYGLLGIFLIIWGSWFIFDTTNEGFSWKLFTRKDINLRIAALICTGIEAVILKKVILLSNVTMSFMTWAWTGALFTFLIVLLSRRKFVPIKSFQIHQYLIICAGLAVMQLSTNYVFQNMKVGYALALFQLSTIVNLVFGIKFFAEKEFGKKLIGTLIMTVGSVIIILCP